MSRLTATEPEPLAPLAPPPISRVTTTEPLAPMAPPPMSRLATTEPLVPMAPPPTSRLTTTEPLAPLVPPPSSDNPVSQLLGDHHHHHHHHHHVHGPAPSESSTLANDDDGSHPHHHRIEHANLEHFNALGADFDKQHPEAAEFADRLLPALKRRLIVKQLDEDTTSVLDYACGSGQVSRVLAPYVAQLVGVDISPRMVEVYNSRANAQGLESHEMRAVNSLDQLDSSQQLFDIAVCSMAYHHFPSVQIVTQDLVKYLKPGATLAVADIARLESDEEDQRAIMAGYEHIVPHTRGFTEEEIRALFEGVGLENVVYERFASAKREGRDIQFFLATGTKPTLKV